MHRIKYEIYSDKTRPSSKPFVYKYSNTNNIEMTVTKTGFFIRASRTVKKEFEELLTDPLYRDAIKKCSLIQLIKYGNICFGTISANINEDKRVIYFGDNDSLICCLCGSLINKKMSTGWKNEQFNRILNTTKSKENRLDASLYALIMAKSKTYETEKFIYLWMAMNGLYGYMAEKASVYMPSNNEKKWIKRECAQLKFFSLFYDLRYRAPDDGDKESFRLQMELVIAKNVTNLEMWNNTVIKEDLCSDIEEVLKKYSLFGMMDVKTVLLLYLPYLVRCKYFHSERAIPLLCFEGEHPIPVIRFLNQVLEDFLDENLHNWMNDVILNDEILPIIKKISKGCKCEKLHLKSCVIDGKEKL